MKPSIYLPKFRLNEKMTVYSGAPVNKGFYQRNLNKARTIYMNNYCKTPKKFYRRRQDKAFNQLLNNYYEDYNKFQKKHQFRKVPPKPIKKDDFNFNFNQYELKKKNLSILFFTNDLKNNEEIDFSMTDKLINSMYNGKDETLIKSTQIKNDYEKRLNENNKNKDKDEIQYNNFINDNDNNQILKREKKIDFREDISSGDQSSSNKNDPNIRINKDKTHLKKIKTVKEDDDDKNIFFLENGDNILDDNYLEFNNKMYLDSKMPLFKDIINSNFNDNYEPPTYIIPQSVLDEEENNKKNKENLQNLINLQKKQTINKYKDGELKRFKDIIMDNEYPCFEQITNPYYPTKYIPPPCFPKLPEDIEEEENEEYGYEDFGFKEKDNNETKEEDDETLILLNNQITNNDYPMFEHLIRNDYKGSYAPPTYKIPVHIEKSIQKEKEKIEKDKENYEKNKKANVENDINQYEDKELKMLNNIIKDDEYPCFEQIINPYYQTNYIPPEIFPKKQLLEENQEEEEENYGDFEEDSKNNDENRNLELINNANDDVKPLFEYIIRNDFKGSYTPPIYKIPDYTNEEKNDDNKQKIQELKGNYVNLNNYDGKEYPTVGEMINSNYEEEKKYEKTDKIDKENFDENEYNDFE